jgi:hypothetical protein
VHADELAHPYYPMHLKVLHVASRPLADNNAVPKNCDLQNFDAYCNEGKNAAEEHVMVVQDANGDRYTISCVVDSRWSKCSPLPVGFKVDGRQEKGGITVVYEDSHGRDKKEFYRIVDTKIAPEPASAANSAPPTADSQARASLPPRTAPPVTTGVSAQPISTSLSPHIGQSGISEFVHCAFSTTPPGAEITLDGKYVGNTPSDITIPTGAHTVLYTLPGYATWTRDLTVLPASELNVSAVLQKAKP